VNQEIMETPTPITLSQSLIFNNYAKYCQQILNAMNIIGKTAHLGTVRTGARNARPNPAATGRRKPEKFAKVEIGELRKGPAAGTE
jgi:hypothetical protein